MQMQWRMMPLSYTKQSLLHLLANSVLAEVSLAFIDAGFNAACNPVAAAACTIAQDTRITALVLYVMYSPSSVIAKHTAERGTPPTYTASVLPWLASDDAVAPERRIRAASGG